MMEKTLSEVDVTVIVYMMQVLLPHSIVENNAVTVDNIVTQPLVKSTKK